MGNPVGRPLKFSSVEELQDKIETFFHACKSEGEIPTITGLAVALDTSRRTLLDYENDHGEEFSHAIKSAKARVENAIEQQLFIGKNAAGPIFNLKNNFGWKDERVQEHKGEVGVRSVSVEGINPKDA